MRKLNFKPVRLVGDVDPDRKRDFMAALSARGLKFNAWLRGKMETEIRKWKNNEYDKEKEGTGGD